MKLRPAQIRTMVAVASTSILLAACATAPTVSDGAVAARADLTRLQADSNLAPLARVEIRDAEEAVTAAERPVQDEQLSQHLVMMADTRVEIARSWAQSRYYQEQRRALTAEADAARLDSRTMEADRARRDARAARSEAETAQSAAVEARSDAETAQSAAMAARRETEMAENQAQAARDEADAARTDAASARSEADLARTATDEARAETSDLQRQITELNARTTDRGLVMTLGDIMFETGKFELRSGTTSNLDKLAAFLTRYEDRTVEIEGHTDSTGNADYNLLLSRQRADSVAAYLMDQGINRNRLASTSMGEERPVSSNDTSTGRQQNRRVEVIISNEQPESQ